MAISYSEKNLMRLLLRSKDTGDGYRKVSDLFWPVVEHFVSKELIDMTEDETGKYVRLSQLGEIVAKYL